MSLRSSIVGSTIVAALAAGWFVLRPASRVEQHVDVGVLPGLTDIVAHPPPESGEFAFNTFIPAAGASYVDPVFGTTIKRLSSDRKFDDIYAKNMAFNADGTRYVHGSSVIDVATGKVTYTVPLGSVSGDSGFDPVDPNVYYYFAGSTIKRVVLNDDRTTTESTFYTASESIAGLGGSVNWWSGDGSLFMVNAGGSVKVVEKATMTTYRGTITAPSGGGWLGIAPSGNHAVGYWADSGRSWKIDKVRKSVGSQVIFWDKLCGDHAVAASGSDGEDYAIVCNCHNRDEIWRVNVDNNAAGKSEDKQRGMSGNKLLTALSPWENGKHFSSVARGPLRDWVFVSFECGACAGQPDGFDSTVPPTWPVLRQEIVGFNILTGEMRRLAHHRSRDVPAEYGYEPRVTSSWGGEYVAWASNFNRPGGADIYAVAFGAAPGRFASDPTAKSSR